MPDPEAGTDERRDDLLALLDQELSRLPGKYRIPVVLCDLEGKTHREAASQLGWPVGTVSSRLSRARAMLAKRLARRGVSLSVGSLAVLLAREATSAPMPTRLIGATARAASLFAAGGASGVVLAEVADLTREVLKMMLLSRLKVTALLLLVLAGTGLIWNGSGALGAGQQGKPEALKPGRSRPRRPGARVPDVAHPTSDAGLEYWVRLEDGRSLWKFEEYAGVHDPASGTELNYRGNSPIVRRPEIVAFKDDGNRDLGCARTRGVKPLDPAEMRRRMTEEGRRIEGGNFASERRSLTSTAAAASGSTCPGPTR